MKMRTDPFMDGSGTKIESHACHLSMTPQDVHCPVYVLPDIAARSLQQTIYFCALATLHK